MNPVHWTIACNFHARLYYVTCIILLSDEGRVNMYATSARCEGGEGVEGEVVKVTDDDQSLCPASLTACRKSFHEMKGM